MRIRELSNVDLDRHFIGNRCYGGAVSKDRLPPLDNKAWIINLQNSTDSRGRPLPGTHWVGLYACRPGVAYYFDPEGESDPPIEVMRRVRESGKRLVANHWDEQSIDSITCGYLVAFVIDRLLAGDEWTNILTRQLKPQRFVANDRKAVQNW